MGEATPSIRMFPLMLLITQLPQGRCWQLCSGQAACARALKARAESACDFNENC